MLETESSEVHAGNTSEMGNHVNNIGIIKHELETKTESEAQTSNSLHSFDGSDMDATIKVENYNSEMDIAVNIIVKTDLVEYYGNTSATTEISHPNHLKKVRLETIPKAETNILGDKSSCSSSDEGEDDICNIDTYNDSDWNSDPDPDPDPERDPFADVDCDPSFSQQESQSHINSIKSITQDEITNASHSLNLKSPSKIKHILVAGNEPKPKRIRQPETLLNSELQCQLCLQNQTLATELKTHLKICAASHKDRHRFCIPCNKLFSTTTHYRKHALKRHGVEEALLYKRYWLHCQLCQGSFPGKKYFIAHLASHHGSTKTDQDGFELRPYRCQECPSAFAYTSGLTNHRRKHKTEVLKCHVPNCEAAFKQKHHLSIHLQRVHSEGRPFNCEEPKCGKTFKRKDLLAEHIMVYHTVGRPLQCSHPGCDRSFKYKESLRQHLMCHTGARRFENVTDRPFKCGQCDRSFCKNSHLTFHLKSHDTDNQGIFPCPEPNCKKICKTEIGVQSHLQSHTLLHKFRERGCSALLCPNRKTAQRTRNSRF